MFSNVWNNIISWFNDRTESNKLIRSFNDSAKEAFISGIAPTFLKASISKGESSYRHQFSNWLYSGFRIQAFTGKALSKEEILHIGKVILSNDMLIRKLVVLGWDTIEIHCDTGNYGCRWQLKDYLSLPNY